MNKSILVITLTLLLHASIAAQMAPACGDCDGDGQIGIVDALHAALTAIEHFTLTEIERSACDVDQSGYVTVLDSLMIAQFAAGLPVTLDCALPRDWVRVATAGFGPNAYSGVAYDETLGATVLAGGLSCALNRNPWVWDGVRWQEFAAAGTPPDLEFAYRQAMVYDNARGVTELFALSYLGAAIHMELGPAGWATLSTPAMFTRGGVLLVYDRGRQVTVLFGGQDSAGPSDEMWEYSSSGWVQISQPALRPLARFDAAGAYDEARQRVVLHGGFNSGFLDDTWEWDGATWIESTATPHPSLASPAAMIWDAARSVSTLVGTTLIGDLETWSWDGGTWTRYPVAVSPPGVFAFALAFDRARQVAVLTGGQTWYGGKLGETWEWNCVTWNQAASLTAPPYCANSTLVERPQDGGVMLLDGMTDCCNSEIWNWDPAGWTRMVPALAPQQLLNSDAVLDSNRQVVVRFGGSEMSSLLRHDETWEWDGVNWQQRLWSLKPAGRSLHAMAYDIARDQTVLFGGYSTGVAGDTWVYDSSGWRQRFPSTMPQARAGHAMTNDSLRGVVVMMGGLDTSLVAALRETWEWNGTDWNRRFATMEPRLAYHAMAYDSARGTTVAYGGYDGTSAFSQLTLEWNGSSWRTVITATNPPPLINHCMAFDRTRSAVVLYGGSSDLRECWELR